jgi:sugar lactone lactonase YvrE
MTAYEVLATGLCFGEGPRWHAGELWFSDMYDHAVKSVDLDGRVTVRVQVDGQSSGLGWLPDGDLVVVSMLDRQLLRLTGGRLEPHADLSGVATFHCNDMVVDAVGRAYVGNFGFDLHAFVEARDPAMIRSADLALVQPDGTVQCAATDLAFPNGTVITPDGRTLVVAETMGSRLTAFDIAADGTLSNRRVWAELPRRRPDGICLDAEGAIWVANAAAAECVRVAEGGQIIDRIETDQPCFACMLGGPDGTTLFMLTAPSSDPAEVVALRGGRVLVSEAPAAHAGRP